MKRCVYRVVTDHADEVERVLNELADQGYVVTAMAVQGTAESVTRLHIVFEWAGPPDVARHIPLE